MKCNVLSGWLYLGMLVLVIIPEQWSRQIKLYDVPVSFILFWIGFFLCSIGWISKRNNLGLVGLIGGGCMAWMLIVGIVKSFNPLFEYRFLFIDLSIFSSLIAGIMLVQTMERRELLVWIRRWSITAAALLLATLSGLTLGIVTSAPGTGRTLVFSLFYGTFLLSMTCPILMGNGISLIKEKRGEWIYYVSVAAIGIGTNIVVAMFTATRSAFIGALMAAAAMLAIAFLTAGGRVRMVYLAACLLFSSLAGMAELGAFSMSDIGGRFSNTALQSEQRFEELIMLFEQMNMSDHLVGKGFGSRFESPVVAAGDNIAMAPHVGVVAFWQKGGILQFIFWILGPIVYGTVRIWKSNWGYIELGAFAGVLLFLVQALLSGGWQLSQLFAYGIFIGLLFQLPASSRKSPGKKELMAANAVSATDARRMLSKPVCGSLHGVS